MKGQSTRGYVYLCGHDGCHNSEGVGIPDRRWADRTVRMMGWRKSRASGWVCDKHPNKRRKAA